MAINKALKIKALELFNKFDCDPFPPIPRKCVYAVFVANAPFPGSFHLVYIGSTIDLERRRRMKSHPYMQCIDRFPNKCVCVMDFESDNYLEDEATLIKYFKPIFNQRGK